MAAFASQASVRSQWGKEHHLGTHTKSVRDQIHGDILLYDRELEAIDTPQYQRLRDLKQLGSSYYVFPGATHNRFEHCLGTGHLAGEMLSHLKVAQPYLDVRAELRNVLEPDWRR